jgi:heat shock protein HslJ
MKKLFLTAVLITTILMSGAAQPSVPGNELTGKTWKLTEVHINDVNAGFNRSDLPKIGLAAVGSFTLIFDAETISGVGAPNRYIAPYTRSGIQISISSIASTKVPPLSGLDKINEQAYFIYLKNANIWNLVNHNRLELSSKTADGKNVLLVFGL